MNIIIFLTYGLSLKNWEESGILHRELNLYKNLEEKFEVNFTFITYGDEEDLIYEKQFKNIKILPIYKYKKKYQNKFLTLFQSILFPFTVKKIQNKKIDIIKTNQLLGSWSAIILKIITKKPLIVRTGYDLYSFSKKDKKNILKQLLYYLLTLLALNVSNIYTVSSRSDFNYILKNYLFAKKKLLIRKNWVQTTNLTKSFNERLDSVLAVGRLEPQKDFHSLIKVFNNSDIELDIIGEGSLKNDLENEIEPNIRILGRVDNITLLNNYLKYKIYISFSDYEGNPKTTLEAMAAGCIVIALNIPNNAEIIHNGINGVLVEKKDLNVIDIVKHFFEDEKEYYRITENAINYVKNNHSLENYIQTEYEDYINNLGM